MEDNGTHKPQTKRQVFLRFMRYVAVTLATVWLLVLMIASADTDDLWFSLIIVLALVGFFITIPIIGFWVYSFIKAVRRRTKTDKILLWFHIVDLLMCGAVICFANQPTHKCDAFIMAQYCRGENAFWMRSTAARYRSMLPDSTRLHIEIENGAVPQSDILSEQDMKELKWLLEDICGCIGIDVNNYSNSGYSTMFFRHVGMGMYSFRFYDHPLSLEQQDSLNSKENLIVFNDSTVFEYGGGAFGSQNFPDKEEFIEKSKSHTEIIKTKDRDWYVNVKPGGFLGNHECISIRSNQSALDDSSCYKFYTDEIYYAVDSAGRLNIYAPYSSIKKPAKKAGSILIHELRDYDTNSKYRKNYSAMGLKRIATNRQINRL